MFSIQDRGHRLCDGLTRREWLRVGGLGALGLSLPALLQGQRAPAATHSGGKAKACILLYLVGGPPQHETWDPKPDAPAEIRGDLGQIASRLPGLIKDMHLVVVEGGPHAIAWTHAGQVNAALLDFLRG